jgi:hypothetical protein
MAVHNRKTRKAVAVTKRFRCETASAAKEIVARLEGKGIEHERTGKFITVSENDISALKRHARAVDAEVEEVLGRGRPRKDSEKATVAKDKKPKKAQTKRPAVEVVEELPAKYKAKKLKTGKTARLLEGKKLKKPSERTKPLWRLVIQSSNLESAIYNVQHKRLTVTFVSGARYRYEKVSIKEFTEFTLAESQGSWFSENIKDVKETTKLPKAKK